MWKCICLALFTCIPFAQAAGPVTNTPINPQVIFQWDRSPDDHLTNGVSYTLYGKNVLGTVTNTTSITGITNSKVGAYDLAMGEWSFYAVAKQSGIESAPSNIVLLSVPAGPNNLKTVLLQYSATINGPFSNSLFIKLYPIP